MKIFRKVITYLIYLLNVVLLIIPFVLEYFGKKKMMMHRFLLSKNAEFEAIFTNTNINIIRGVLVLFIAIGVIVLIKKNRLSKYTSILSILLSILTLVLTFNDFSLKAYYFMLLAAIVNSVLGMVNIGVNLLLYKTLV